MAVTHAPTGFFDWTPSTDKFAGQTWDFFAEPNGHLRCEECGTEVWCKHINMMIQDNGDSATIFEQYEAAKSEPLELEVPVFPSSNLWQRVGLEAHPKIRAFKVWILNNDSVNYLGFLNEGEGRNVMRSMFFDWFIGMVEFSSLECSSASHKFQAQVAWESAMRDRPAQLANYFSVWNSKACLHCRLLVGSMNSDDLVPDAGDGQPRPWNR